MSELVLVRHGQAMAFDRDSDRLSPLGEQQSRTLGEYWKRHGVAFDVLYTGTLRRHVQTYELAAAAPLPAPRANPGLNEYDAAAILAAAQVDMTAFTGPDRNKHFQRVFEDVMAKWRANELAGCESWDAFRGRVNTALRDIMAESGSRRVAVFTSGGPIGVAVQAAMKAPEGTAIEVNWRVRNTSLTSFLFSGSRVSLDGFNATPHLAECRELESYR